MFDLMTIAFQADITRISTFIGMAGRSATDVLMLGISEAFHPASHHQNNAERLAQLTRIQTFHQPLVVPPGKASATDGDGAICSDHSLVLSAAR